MVGLCVNSIAELKALAAGVVPCLTVLGYYTQGDGGGGSFYWDASESRSDNGGTIIAPASTPPKGRWKRLAAAPVPPNPGTPATFNPKWWGAKGDGITIDTQAFQTMIHATTTPGAPGPHYHIPAGLYAIDQTLLFDGLAGGLVTGDGSGFVWEGGFDTTYQNPIPAIHIRNSQYMVWQNIGIIVGPGKRLAEGWRLTTHPGGLILNEGHTFIACGAAGTTDELELGVRIGGDKNFNNCSHCFINCKFANFGNAAVEIQDSQCFNINVFGCTFVGYTNVGTPNNNITVAKETAVLSWDPKKFPGFQQKDVGKWIEITQDDGNPNNVVRTTIKAWDPGTPDQVTINEQCPIWCHGGK